MSPVEGANFNLCVSPTSHDDIVLASNIFGKKVFGVLSDAPLALPEFIKLQTSVPLTVMYSKFPKAKQITQDNSVEIIKKKDDLEEWSQISEEVTGVSKKSTLEFTQALFELSKCQFYRVKKRIPLLVLEVYLLTITVRPLSLGLAFWKHIEGRDWG